MIWIMLYRVEGDLFIYSVGANNCVLVSLALWQWVFLCVFVCVQNTVMKMFDDNGFSQKKKHL